MTRLFPTLTTLLLLLLNPSPVLATSTYPTEASALKLVGRAREGHSAPSIANRKDQPTTGGTDGAAASDPDKGGGTSTSQQKEQQQQHHPTEKAPCSMLMGDVRQPVTFSSAVDTKSTVAYSHMSAEATSTAAATGSASATAAQETITASYLIVSVPCPVPDALRSFLSGIIAEQTVATTSTFTSLASRDAEETASVSPTVAPGTVAGSSIVSEPDPVPNALRSYLSRIIAEPTVAKTSIFTSIASRDAEGTPNVSPTVAQETVTASSIVSVPSPVPDGLRSYLSRIAAEPTVSTTTTFTSIVSRDVGRTASVSPTNCDDATASGYGDTTSTTPPCPTATTATRAAKMSNSKPPGSGPPPPKNPSPAVSRPTDDDDESAASASGSAWSNSMSDLPPLLQWIEFMTILLTAAKDVIKYVWRYVWGYVRGKCTSWSWSSIWRSNAKFLEKLSSPLKVRNRVQGSPV
ncbi:hypothetical protein BJV74DRAFT_990030 [Russula compacta]|nr:hypothetical protein BJV74DRAFT_990030 [Russula compacta]